MISAQTLRVCREGKPLHNFPDHALVCGGRQRLRRSFDGALRDQPLQFGNAGAAIGAGLELGADARPRCARRSQWHRRSVARPTPKQAQTMGPVLATPSVGAARQQQAALIVGERVQPRTGSSPRPSRRHHARGRRTGRSRCGRRRTSAARYTPPPKSRYSAISSPAAARSQAGQRARSALSANR